MHIFISYEFHKSFVVSALPLPQQWNASDFYYQYETEGNVGLALTARMSTENEVREKSECHNQTIERGMITAATK